jgi:vitamin B12 transporter
MAILLTGTTPVFAQNAGVFDLDEIVFSAGLSPQEADRIGVSLQVVTEEDLVQAGNIQLSDFIATLPGVTVTRSGPPGTNATLRIRGAGQGLIGVYIDGILVNDPTSTSGQFTGIDGLTTGSLRRVEILRGSQSAVYGTNAVAGVISISTVAIGDEPEGVTQRAAIEGGSFNTLATNYSYTNRTGPLTLSFGATHSRSDGFSAAEENKGNSENDPSRNARLSFGAIYELTPSLTVGANLFHESSRSEFDEFVGGAPADGTPGDEKGSTKNTGLRVFAEYDALSWSHKFTANYLETDRDVRSVTVLSPFSTPFESGFSGERSTLQYLATTEAFAATTMTFGLDWKEDSGNFTGLIGNARSIRSTGVFAEANWAASSSLDIFASARFEDSSAFGDVTTGRLAFSYRASDATAVRGAMATGYRAPVLSELFGTFPIGNGQFFLGNAGLQPEQSVSYELGLDHSLQNGGKLSATVYRLEVDNFIVYQDCTRAPVTFVCTTAATNANVAGATTLQGVEFSATYPLSGRVMLTGAYTYTDAKQANGARVARVPLHDFALSLDAKITDRLNGSLSLQHVADRPDDGFPAVAMDDYTVVNANVRYEITDNLDATFRIENLFDEQYQQVAGYGTSDRAFYVGLSSRF